jgi:hypothetical protein
MAFTRSRTSPLPGSGSGEVVELKDFGGAGLVEADDLYGGGHGLFLMSWMDV